MKSFLHFYYELFQKISSRKTILISILVPFCLIFCLCFFALNGIVAAALGSKPAKIADSSILTEGIAKQVLRLHVIANSDSDTDQAIKLKVKDGLIEYMKTFLTDASSKEETIALINEHQAQLKQRADEILSSLGVSYTSNTYLGKVVFPVKVYGDITLPAGEYDALCVHLGKAEGKNWWCIVFPNLCFVDSTYSVVPKDSKAELAYLLTDEEYEAITANAANEDSSDTTVVVRFKLWEWLCGLFS